MDMEALQKDYPNVEQQTFVEACHKHVLLDSN